MTSVPRAGLPGTNFERTFIAVKPDGVQRGKVGDIIGRFENKGYKLVALKMLTPSKELAEGHYADLKSKPFFPGLVSYFSSGPIVAMCWEGVNAIAQGRSLLGATNPKDSLPGTIRGDLCVDIGRNICHGSDGPDSAKHEIEFWFTEEEVQAYTSCAHNWVYEKGAAVRKGAAPKAAAAPKEEQKAGSKKKKKSNKKKGKGGAKEAAPAPKEDPKKVKACIKEGGKKGQDLSGMSVFGCHFFLTTFIEPEGDMSYLQMCMDGANKPVDPEGDDRKGGAGDLGKIFFSAGDKELSIICHVPEERKAELSCADYLNAILGPLKDAGVKPVIEKGTDENFLKVNIKGNPDANVFPLKLRDECVARGFDFLKSKGLILDDESDDENYADAAGVDLNAGADDYGAY
jgi:nucleoside-diphosphate kinase